MTPCASPSPGHVTSHPEAPQALLSSHTQTQPSSPQSSDRRTQVRVLGHFGDNTIYHHSIHMAITVSLFISLIFQIIHLFIFDLLQVLLALYKNKNL